MILLTIRHKWRSTLNKYAKKFHALSGIFRILCIFPAIFIALNIVFLSCSFDYGSVASGIDDIPDITMEDVEYVRVRNGDPKARFTAEHASRYEDRQTMELKNLSFEQFENHGERINAEGRAGSASVELESGNIRMDGGVHITIESEDYIIETGSLEWHDKDRILSSGANEVNIRRNDGTNFNGHGFSADVRNRTWSFSAGVSGTYIHEDKEEEERPERTRGEQARTPTDTDFTARDEGEAASLNNPLSEREIVPAANSDLQAETVQTPPQPELEEADISTDIDSEIQKKEEDVE